MNSLQACENRDVVLRRRTAVDHPDTRRPRAGVRLTGVTGPRLDSFRQNKRSTIVQVQAALSTLPHRVVTLCHTPSANTDPGAPTWVSSAVALKESDQGGRSQTV